MREFRCIVFNDREVITAIIDRRRRRKASLPVGTAKDISFTESASEGLVSSVRIVDDYGTLETIHVRLEEIVAALVDYCVNRRIPIPNTGNKWIEWLNEGELTLMMNVEQKVRKKHFGLRYAKA
ncbi:MAG: hypothetical protein WCF85_17530 [Rhodospirillaceae bacterium]